LSPFFRVAVGKIEPGLIVIKVGFMGWEKIGKISNPDVVKRVRKAFPLAAF